MAVNKSIVDWKTITSFVVDAFVGYGIPREDAEICADVLLESDKRGIESHGVNRFKPIYLDRIKDGIQSPVTNFEIVKETPTTAVVDGHDGMGQVLGYKSMQMAIDKAKEYGMGMVVVRNSCHYGIAGYYTSMATKQAVSYTHLDVYKRQVRRRLAEMPSKHLPLPVARLAGSMNGIRRGRFAANLPNTAIRRKPLTPARRAASRRMRAMRRLRARRDSWRRCCSAVWRCCCRRCGGFARAGCCSGSVSYTHLHETPAAEENVAGVFCALESA